VAGRLAGVVSATPAIAERFSGHRASQVIQNFPLLSEFYRSGAAANAERPYVVYAGAIAPGRGILESIKAVPLTSSRTSLRLAGPFSSYVLSDFEAPSVSYLGVLERSRLPGLLANALAGLVLFSPLPNHVKAQPNKLFEYMSAGIPVIASNFPLWRDIIEREGCGLVVDPSDPCAIAQAIDRLAANPDEARLMGLRGRKAVEMKYNWENEEKKLFRFYSYLLEGNSLGDR
jgi:glycosyltransferase involved in cell wall biosynthesis